MEDWRWKNLVRSAGTRLVSLLALAVCGQAAAVEIRLRPQAACSAGVVRLHDVADLVGDASQVAELAAVELLPAPPTGEEKRLSARELEDLLQLRGIDMAGHHVCGAERVAIAVGTAPDRSRRTARAAAPSRRQLEATVAAAVKRHLEHVADVETLGEIRPQLSDAAVQQLAGANGPLTASGGQAPWTGTQQFEFCNSSGDVRLTLTVDVAPARQVFTLSRPLNRGAVLSAADVELAPQLAVARLDDAFENLDDVVGKELLQGGVAGQVLRRAMLRAPVLVKQGRPVTVYSRAAGIQVRTVGLAKDDGSQGELVAVESPETKQRYFARVVGMQEVEIWAAATAVPRTVAASPNSRSGDAR